MVVLKEITVLTTQYNQWIRITDEIERVMKESGIQNGIVNVISRHTTTAAGLRFHGRQPNGPSQIPDDREPLPPGGERRRAGTGRRPGGLFL